MVDVDKAVIARLKKGKEIFEVLVDCEPALQLKSGAEISIADVLAAELIFADAKKGLTASDNTMSSLFGTTNKEEIAREIITNGDIQITAEHRKKILEQKKKQVIDYLNSNGVDPRTGRPHPAARIELAFEEAKIRIDEYKSVKIQIEEIIKRLKPILPISFEKKELMVKIPASYAAKGYPIVSSQGTIKSENWQTDGSWLCNVFVPAGRINELIDKLNDMTHGEVEITKVK